jgi:riboflavin synthase
VFTGLVEETGRIRRSQPQRGVQRITVEADAVLQGLAVGDSVNLSGACQTAVHVDADSFSVEAVPETLRLTTLGMLQQGDAVNLERALSANGRLGGHLVMGHVDGIGRITDLVAEAGRWVVSIEAPPGLERYLADKGSVCVDGISLTIVQALQRRFSVAVIPHTFEHTTLGQRRSGDAVNLEVDVLARYVEKLLQGRADEELSWDSLRDMGY